MPPESGGVPGYEIVRKLGEGGMGVVYQARDLKLNRYVALKMVLSAAADRRGLIRFLAEAEAVASVRHPNVVQVYQYGESQRRPYMALEFCPGGTLAQRLKGGTRLDPGEAAELLARVAAGVAAAHAQGIVHRDLKPGNILFDAADHPKVADFGLAKRGAGTDLTQTGAVMGTPSYMAPEQAGGGTKFVGPQADVWALGVVLYECLTGERPFTGGSTDQVLARVLLFDPAPLRSVLPGAPRDLDLICRKCLEKNPADRYPTAKELANDLQRFVAGEPISVRRPGTVERTYKWVRRKPTQAVAVALVCFSLLVSTVGTAVAVLWREAVRERDTAEHSRADAVTARDQFEQQKTVAERLQREADRARADLLRANYFRSIDLAWRAHRDGNLPRARQLLADAGPDHHGWEREYIARRLDAGIAADAADGPADGLTHSFQNTPDGRFLAAVYAPDDDSPVQVRVWDAATGRAVRTLPPAGQAEDARLSADGAYALVRLLPEGPPAPVLPAKGPIREGLPERTVQVFEVATGREVGQFRSDRMLEEVTGAAGGVLAVRLGRPGTGRAWRHAGQGYEVTVGATIPGVPTTPAPGPGVPPARQGGEPAPAPKPQQVTEPKGNPESQPSANELFLFDLRAGRKAAALALGDKPISEPTLVLDGKQIWAVEEGKKIRAWDAATGRARPLDLPAVAFAAPGPAFLTTADGRIVAARFDDNTVGLVDVERGEVVHRYTAHKRPAPQAMPAPGKGDAGDGPQPAPNPGLLAPQLILVAFNPDGTRLTLFSFGFGPIEVRTLDTRTGKAVQDSPPASLPAEWAARPLTPSPDGRWAALLPRAGEDLELVNLATGQRGAIELGGRAGVTGVTFARDGRRAAAVRGAKLLGVWDVSRPDSLELPVSGWVSGLTPGYSPDGTHFLVTAPREKVWTADGEQERGGFVAFDTRTGLPQESDATTAAGNKYAARYAYFRDGRSFLYEVAGGAVTSYPAGGGQTPTTVTVPAANLAGSVPIWHPDGRKFLTVSGGIRQWDAATGKEEWRIDVTVRPFAKNVTTYQSQARTGTRAGPDGKPVSYTYVVMVPVTVTVLSSSHSVVISPDGKLVAVHPSGRFPGDAPGVRLFDAATGTDLATLPEEGVTRRVVFSPDATRVALLSGDRAAVHDVRSGRALFRVVTPGIDVLAAAFTPDGTRLATGGASGGVVLWDAKDGREVCTLSNVLGRTRDQPRPTYGYAPEATVAESPVADVFFHPDGSQMAVASRYRVQLLRAR